ncbi:response regulator [Alienimonas chondri]|uniref:response regulator n=1 Tax=Alienimonas chondri TaxID=2681879 RepID=UPI0019D655C2|nr:response regulator [Alienimonas chondri]
MNDPLLRAITMRRLELLGYRVVPLSEDPAATPSMAEEEGVHAVLIDLELPDGAGLRIVERLASGDATAALPVLGLAADTPQGLVEEAFAAGVADFLILPYDPLVLEAKAAALLARSAVSAPGPLPARKAA